MSTAVAILLILLATPAVVSCVYLLILTILSASIPTPKPSSSTLRFDVIVPAHNEAGVIQRTIASLRQLDWPADKFRILVVADNCNDDTATLARNSGAEALVRNDETRRGKGYALQYAFSSSKKNEWADAVVVIDADAEVSSNLLEAFAARIELGAMAVQAHYGVLNTWTSWRTRLITIAKAAFHIVRSRARERLRVSCGIRGNGWCVTHELLDKVPYQAFSLTEDLEYGITLGQAGYRVHYADEAHSDAEMVSVEHTARRQRQRWEDGRFQLIRAKTLPLLLHALRQPSKICLDLALDLMVLPLSYVVMNVIALLILGVLATLWNPLFVASTWIAIACCTALLLHVARGWQLSGIGIQGLNDLARAPGFLLWKMQLMVKRRESNEWVRTEREKS